MFGGRIGMGELLVIAVIFLLLFGAGRLSDIGKGLADGIRNFKRGLKEGEDDDKSPLKQMEGGSLGRSNSKTTETKA
ncbi:MAG: twin-arginine translocase TatA/TatE family subunit [Myxococcales bacterium]|nr:twin-arginine translocase TatA/TatE family subunit [Polyangiaceae bacterium]MDW8249554.1 twin-arginine translocase TatA/TatE family subunit [Myxococcales bacterium]